VNTEVDEMVEAAPARRKKKNAGFTLIELLIVIAILGILAIVVVLSVGGTTSSSKKQACTADRQTLTIALEAYHASYSGYPSAMSDLVSKGFLVAPSTSYTFAAGTNTLTAVANNPNGCV